MAERLTLRDLLPARIDSVGEQARARLCENQDIGGMKLAWDYIGSQLSGALGQALDCDLMEVVAKGWAEADLLAEFADPAKHPAGEQSIVEIGRYDYSRELKPVIAVTIGSCPCVELEFKFAVSANFGGVQLAIADGHVTGGRMGEAWASAQLSFQGQPLHDPAETRKLQIPGLFQFEPPGVPIPAVAH